MEIGLIYSENDPKQIETRDFIRKFVKEHGILAELIETKKPVKVPKLLINGCCVYGEEPPSKSKLSKIKLPNFNEIARAIEHSVWSL